MSRHKRIIKKEPSDVNLESSVDSTVKLNLTEDNFTTELSESQEDDSKQDSLKGRHFVFVVYPESAPADWIEQLQDTGLPFVVSPLHDKDVNPDGTIKKAHYHVIVSWSNTTTYRSARGLCDMLKCPKPQLVKSCIGQYRYLTHADNPEKYQYKEMPKTYNGWVRPLDNADIANIKQEIWNFVFEYDCTEYTVLLSVCSKQGSDYFEIASRNTIFFKAICDGYRHNPINILTRMYELSEDESEKEKIKNLIEKKLSLKNGNYRKES